MNICQKKFRRTARELADELKGVLTGPDDLVVTGVAGLEEAGPEDLVFVSAERFAALWGKSPAKVALVSRSVVSKLPAREGVSLIVVDDADVSLAALLRDLTPPPPQTTLDSRVHPSAVVHPTARLGEGVRIGAYCVVGPGVELGDRTVLYPNVTVFDNARTGRDCVLWSGVVLRERCVLGDRVVLHANCVVGADGFGYRPAPDGNGLVKILHIGHVEIGNDVEIGANTCIDRGKLSATVIGDHCKIDNLCQIGHNCRLGKSVIIAGKVGISGSVTIGDGVMIGGGAGVADHVTIGRGAAIAAAAGVMRDVPPGGKVSGIPARDLKQFFRELAALARLPDMLRRPRIVAAGQVHPVAPPRQQSFHAWLEDLNAKSSQKIVIRDFDGVHQDDFETACRHTLMTEQEFRQKLARCTIQLKM